MACDCKQEARKEYSESNDSCANECIANSSMYIPSLKTYEGRKNDQGCRQNITNSDAIDKDLLG